MNAPGLVPTAAGSLEKTPFVHLLVYLADRLLSGSLVLAEATTPAREHTVYFFQGAASKVRTGEPIAHLGRVLFELAHITEDVLNSSLVAIAGGRELHGEHLIRIGAIDRVKLMVGLRAQIVRKIAYLFALPLGSTTYAFYQDQNLLESWGGPELTPLDPLPTLWAATRARADEPIVDATLARLGPNLLKLHDDSEVGRFGFSPQERTVVDFMRARPCTLAELIEYEVAPARTVQLVVYVLLITRHLDHGTSAAPPVGVQPVSETARLRAASPGGPVPLGRVKLTARRPDDRPSGSSTSGGARASGSFAAVAAAPSSSLSDSSAASSTGAAPSSSRGSPASGSGAASPDAPRSSTRSSNPPPLSPDHAARRDVVLRRAEGIDKEDYFAMLGVSKEASEGDIQTAYYALAKIWHPDRLPPELGSARDAVSKVFARMSEAFETLSEPAKRKRYLEMLKGGGGGTPEEAEKIQQIIDAATDFQRAEILWRKRDPGAEQYIVRAYEADPEQSDYVALYAMLQLSKRPADAAVDDIVKLCDYAIERSERCERAYFCRANAKKRAGRVDSAMSDFRAAYQLNPKNLDAAREVRLYEMRRGKQSPERRSTPPAVSSKSSPPTRSSLPPKKPSGPPDKKDGVLSGIGKLFKR